MRVHTGDDVVCKPCHTGDDVCDFPCVIHNIMYLIFKANVLLGVSEGFMFNIISVLCEICYLNINPGDYLKLGHYIPHTMPSLR